MTWLRDMAMAAWETARRDGLGSVVRETNRVVRREARRTTRSRVRSAGPVERSEPVPSSSNPVAAPRTLAEANRRLTLLDDAIPEPTVHASSAVHDGRLEVAVVVPAYDAADHLRDCLESVSSQTHTAWTCYIVDDASSDATAAIAAEYAADDRFVLLRHGRNGGLSAARNTGLGEANEPLIIFLDADDLLVPTSLERRVDALRPHWADVRVAGTWAATPLVPEEVTIDDARRMDRDASGPTVHATSHRGECPFNVHAPLLRTELIRRLGGFDERLRLGGEDWDLWHRMLRHGYTIESAGGRAGVYRQRPGSMARRDQTGHVRVADGLLRAAHRSASTEPDLTVDASAARPLPALELAAARLQRIALSAGIQVGASAELSIDAGLREFIDPVPAAMLAGLDLRERATAGLHRGLGLGTARFDLDPEAASRADRVADWIVGEIDEWIRAAPPIIGEMDDPVDCRVLTDVPDVVLAAETAADVVAMDELHGRLVAAGWLTSALDIDVAKGDEGATAAWHDRGVTVVSYNHVRFGRVRPSVMVVRRPFGPVTAELADALRLAGTRIVEFDTGERAMRLECNASEQQPVDAVWAPTVDIPRREGGISALVSGAGADIAPLGRVNGFARRLVAEENSLDAASTAYLRSLKDCHRGETVVVVGNGPSLNDIDLGLLAGVPTFAVNGIFYAENRFPDPITYYVIEDTSVFRENTEAIKAFSTQNKLFPTLYRDSYTDAELHDNLGFFRMNGGFYGRDTGTECHPRFSVDAAQRLYCGQSVTLINLQLAYWMGFSRVVLIGMDFSYTIPEDADRKGDVLTSRSDDVNHFHKDYFGKGKTWKDPKLERVLVNYALARDMFIADDREIVNATVGGNLHLFRRMPLADALSSA